MSEKKKSEFSKYPTEDKVILIIGYILLGLFCVAIILPMIYIILASFIDPVTLQNKGLTFDFSKWTLTHDMVGDTVAGDMSFKEYIKKSFSK